MIPAHGTNGLPGESPQAYVTRLVDEKARAVPASCNGGHRHRCLHRRAVDNLILGKRQTMKTPGGCWRRCRAGRTTC